MTSPTKRVARRAAEADGRICLDCGEWGAAHHYSRDTTGNLIPYCKPCMSKRSLRAYDLNTLRANQAITAKNGTEFSRSVCRHLATYLDRKIQEFEAATSQEAPPHVTAIRSIAHSFVAQHPPTPAQPKPLVVKHCVTCNTDLTGHPELKHCPNCVEDVARQRRREYKKTPEYLAYRRKAEAERRARQRAERGPTLRPCDRCGTQIEASHRRKYCDTCRPIAYAEIQKAWQQTPAGKEAAARGRRKWKAKQRAQRLDNIRTPPLHSQP